MTSLKAFITEAVDLKERNRKHADLLVKKMLAELKRQKAYIGHVDHTVQGDVHTVLIENSQAGGPGSKYGFSWDMEAIVHDSPLAQFISRKEHPGSFDWASDTYIKDASEVKFKC
jgi:diacylglycerol kinase family enzyme